MPVSYCITYLKMRFLKSADREIALQDVNKEGACILTIQCVAINETYSRGKLIYLLLLELRIFVMKTTLTFEKSPQSLDTVIRLRGSKST